MKHIKLFEDFVNEAGPGLWANIRAKRARGEAPARKGSKAYKSAVAAGNKINERISRDAAYIHGILQTGQDAAQNFIDDNGLDGEKLSDYVKVNRNNIDGYNVKHYISGERGTVGSVPKLRQAFIKKFKKGKSVNESDLFNEAVKVDIDLAQITVDVLADQNARFSEELYINNMTRDIIRDRYGKLPRGFAGPTTMMAAGEILSPLAGDSIYMDDTDLVKGDKTVMKVKPNTTWADVKKALEI
jgi:hypothetical protein